jgi:cytochrome c oxidase subunit IV
MDAAQQHGHEDVSKHVRVYIMVFIALACLTAVTVGISYLHLGSRWINVAVALLIASVKGSLVAAYFMHLISEKKVIFAVLGLTGFFFLLVVFIPLFTNIETPLAIRG